MKFKTREMTCACGSEPWFHPVFIHYFNWDENEMGMLLFTERVSAEDGFLEFVSPPLLVTCKINDTLWWGTRSEDGARGHRFTKQSFLKCFVSNFQSILQLILGCGDDVDKASLVLRVLTTESSGFSFETFCCVQTSTIVNCVLDFSLRRRACYLGKSQKLLEFNGMSWEQK